MPKKAVLTSFATPDLEPEPEVVSTPVRARKPVKPEKQKPAKLTIDIDPNLRDAWKTFAIGEKRTLQALIISTVNDYIKRRSK